MSRRSAATSDSLDLLLDAICNTFGGILFIALLVVLLLQFNSDHRSEPMTSGPTISEQEFEQIQRELAMRHEELRRLRELRRGQQQTLAALVPDSLDQLIQEYERISRQRDELRESAEQLLRELAQRTQQVQNIQTRLQQLEMDLTSARREVAELQDQAEQERATRRQEMRTPVVRNSATKSSVGLVLQYGRLYLWHRYDQFGARLGLNDAEFVVIGEDAAGFRTTPIPTAGVPLDGTPESNRQIRDRLRQFSPIRNYLTVVVRPDSHGAFKHLRTAMMESGFDYRLMPTSNEDRVRDRGGSDSRIQ